MSLSKSVCVFLGLLAVSVLIHFQALDQPMVYDSKVWIGDKAHIFASHNITEVLSIVPARPAFMLTLYGNYLFAGMDPSFFRLVNAIISAAAGLALALLARMVLGLPQLAAAGSDFQKTAISVFLGLLFVIHPLQAYVVVYIWQREAILACFFYLAALAAYLTGTTRGERPLPYYLLTGLLFFLGIFSKENLITFPIVALLAELTLLRRTLREAMGKALLIGAITIPPLIAYLALTHMLHSAASVHAPGILARLGEHYRTSQITPIQVALTECRIFFTYLTSVIVPFAVDLTLVKAVTISRTLLDPSSTLPAVAGVLAWIAASVWAIRNYPVVAFGGLFFIIVILPESMLIPQFLFFGYRPLLPMAGLLLILGSAIAATVSWGEVLAGRRLLAPALGLSAVAYVAALGLTSAAQAAKWNPLHVWETAYSLSPRWSDNVERQLYTDILVNYGAELVNSRQYADAAPILSQAIELDPAAGGARNNLGNAMMGMGRFPEAIEVFQKAIQANHHMPELYLNLGAAFLRTQRPKEAKEAFASAVEINPGFAKAQANLGMLCLQLGEVAAAVEHLTEAVKIDPGLALAQSRLGRAYEQTGDYSLAATHYAKALSLAPRMVEAHFGLGNVLARLNDKRAAMERYRQTLALDPNHFAAENNLGLILLSMSQFSQAAERFRRAIEIRPDFAEARANLETALKKEANKGQ